MPFICASFFFYAYLKKVYTPTTIFLMLRIYIWSPSDHLFSLSFFFFQTLQNNISIIISICTKSTQRIPQLATCIGFPLFVLQLPQFPCVGFLLFPVYTFNYKAPSQHSKSRWKSTRLKTPATTPDGKTSLPPASFLLNTRPCVFFLLFTTYTRPPFN